MNIQDRYDTKVEVRTIESNKRVYRSLRPRAIEPDPTSDIEIEASDATRMDKLSGDTFGSALDWWRFASVNGNFKGSMYFKPGTKIIIPVKR